MANFDIKDIKGVIPAALTFFDENENVDERRTREMTEFMINAGVHGFYLTGSTGLAYTMTGEERNRSVDIVCDQVTLTSVNNTVLLACCIHSRMKGSHASILVGQYHACLTVHACLEFHTGRCDVLNVISEKHAGKIQRIDAHI